MKAAEQWKAFAKELGNAAIERKLAGNPNGGAMLEDAAEAARRVARQICEAEYEAAEAALKEAGGKPPATRRPNVDGKWWLGS